MADKKEEECCLEERSSPHEAIFYVLAYLPLFQLLNMARVCRSLKDAINTDILPWLRIIVDRPINWRISDDILMEVASRAKGRLQVLVLINCPRITDDGLLRIVSQNPHITKLHVPGCTNLSPEGIINAVMLLTKHNHTLTSLKIHGLYNLQKHHLHTLHSLLNIFYHKTQHKTDKIFYHDYTNYSTLKAIDTNRPIDLDICPKCDEVTKVLDCPRIFCDNKQCRGCASCIVRCAECGICIKDSLEQEHATCGDTLCLDCWLKLPKCNFCNKPYCNRHVHHQHRLSSGFICAYCHSEFN